MYFDRIFPSPPALSGSSSISLPTWFSPFSSFSFFQITYWVCVAHMHIDVRPSDGPWHSTRGHTLKKAFSFLTATNCPQLLRRGRASGPFPTSCWSSPWTDLVQGLYKQPQLQWVHECLVMYRRYCFLQLSQTLGSYTLKTFTSSEFSEAGEKVCE